MLRAIIRDQAQNRGSRWYDLGRKRPSSPGDEQVCRHDFEKLFLPDRLTVHRQLSGYDSSRQCVTCFSLRRAQLDTFPVDILH